MDLEVFPYDQQNCHVTVKTNLRLYQLLFFPPNMYTATTFLQGNINHPIWKITGQWVEPTESVDPDQTAGIRFWFRMERKSAFYIWNLLLPTVLISLTTVRTVQFPSSF